MSQRSVAHWLICHAARRTPQSLAERLEEEWLADLGQRPSGFSRLRFAIGCCWATQVIAWEHQPSRVAATGSAPAGNTVIAYADQNFGFISVKSSTFFLVVSLHALLLYGLMTALSHTHETAAPAPLQNRDLPPSVPNKPPPVLPGPSIANPTFEVPKPNTDVVYAPEPDNRIAAYPVDAQLPSTPAAPTTVHVAKRVDGGAGIGFPDTADFYPPPAIRSEEQGVSTLQVCVDIKGLLTSDPTIVKGSGSARLDEGALRLARAGSGHYRPSTEDGQPVNSCYPLGIRFSLKN